MKSKTLFLSIILAALTFGTGAQDRRTVKTKVADILMYLPAEDNAQADRLFKELTGLGDEGIALVTSQIQPNGIEAGVPYRYAVSLLTHFAKTPGDKALIERNYLRALGESVSPDVKAYLLDNLKWIGSNASIPSLTSLIYEQPLSDQAIAALEIIGTAEAKQALLTALNSSPSFAQARLMQALGRARYQSAFPIITKNASSADPAIKRSALWSLAMLGNLTSGDLLLQAAKGTGFRHDPSEATEAFVEFLHVIKGNNPLVTTLSKALLDGTTTPAQQHYRLSALEAWTQANTKTADKMLVTEMTRFDAEYRKEVLNIAAPLAAGGDGEKFWIKEYKKQKGDAQGEILAMLASANKDDGFVTGILIPGLSSANPAVRKEAAHALADTHDTKYETAVADYLLRSTDEAEVTVAKAGVLELTGKDSKTIAQRLATASPQGKIALLQIIAARRAKDAFDAVLAQTTSADAAVRKAALETLPFVSQPANTPVLLEKLSSANAADAIASYQSALSSGTDEKTIRLVNEAYDAQKLKLIPVLPYLNDKKALEKVTTLFSTGNEAEKDAAFTALQKWQNADAVRTLISIRKDNGSKKYHTKALTAALSQTVRSSLTDDAKVLLLREILPLAADKQEKLTALRAFGNVRTFLSFVVVSSYINDPDLGSVAIRTTNQLALPTADARPGMTGAYVRETLEKIKDKLRGEDSQYELIDVESYLAKMPYTRGYESIFNGKDLTGWQGLVENPILRSKMKADLLVKKQKEADAAIAKNWSVKDGMIMFQGDGANLCTIRPYGDFEMIVDWRISKNGDSGIYLRGSPQVQIWDIARVDAGAQVGSGGLYNNQKERSTPLVVADNPVGEWNTFRIRMVGDKVTVHLNGIVVVDNVTLENYWDRSIPIFPSEAIELQAHGTDLAFRDIYVRELDSGVTGLSLEEKKEGFVSLFNGKDLDQWVGNKTEYVVEENTIALYPTKEGHGNLSSAKEYSNFVFRFEFQLTPGANNGIGIHAPLEGDAAYAGKEIQVLDDTAPVYAALEPWQYHGSVYGIIAAKRGHLKPVGGWNQEEISVNGDVFKVTLNGTVITEGNVKELSKKGTLDHKEHPGLLSHKGHIEFLGHGSVVRFRNIRIKE